MSEPLSGEAGANSSGESFLTGELPDEHLMMDQLGRSRGRRSRLGIPARERQTPSSRGVSVRMID